MSTPEEKEVAVYYTPFMDEEVKRLSDTFLLHFTEERHAGGPKHYSVENANCVLEVYPASEERPCGFCGLVRGEPTTTKPRALCRNHADIAFRQMALSLGTVKEHL